MADKETTEKPESERPKRAEDKPLPAKVERALAAARAAAKADHARKSGRWLAVIPVSIGVVFMLFMMPRSTPPDGVPVPRVDHRVTAAIARAEDHLADEAEANRLPGDILGVGTLLRDFNTAEAERDHIAMASAKGQLEQLLAQIVPRAGSADQLLELRAAMMRTFLNALAEWENGREPKDFVADGGSFVHRADEAGWVKDHHLLLDDTQRRVAFKTVWNAITHLEGGKFALTLDEERSLYAFYIQHPRVPENSRVLLEGALRDAKSPDACQRARAEMRRQQEMWRADKIKRLGAIDPKYPTPYALGVVYSLAGRADLAVDAFNAFLEAHPEGPYALLARNHLKAALAGTAP